MQVTLNGTETYKLLGWSKNHFTKQTKAGRIEALKKLGIQVLCVEGRGLKAMYDLDIPNAFWNHLTIPNMHMNEVSARYLEWKRTNDVLVDTTSGNQIILFEGEVADMFAEEFGIEMETARTTIKRIKKTLMENDYLYEDDGRKMHRFKRKKNENWITGDEAVSLHLSAKLKWKRFYDKNAALAQRINHEWDRAPHWLIQDEIKEFYFQGLATELELKGGVYKVAKLMRANQNFHDDIAWAKRAFLESNDMEMVRDELANRQAGYREEKAKREQEIKELTEARKAEMAKERPSWKEQEALYKQFQKEKRIGDIHRVHVLESRLQPNLDENKGVHMNVVSH
ncbi:hypothetical protein ABET09_14900 [Priestia megaterium]